MFGTYCVARSTGSVGAGFYKAAEDTWAQFIPKV